MNLLKTNNLTKQMENEMSEQNDFAKKMDEIEKLAGLKEKGVLTEEEFQTQKQILLKGTEKVPTSLPFQLKKGVTSLSFFVSKGFLKQKMVFSDQNDKPVYWVSEDKSLGDAITIYEDETKTKPIATLNKEGSGSRLWSEVAVNDGNGVNNLGTVKWNGGINVTKWIIRTNNGVEVKCEENVGIVKYLVKIIHNLVATVIIPLPFTKSGSLSLYCQGSKFGKIKSSIPFLFLIKRKYTIENVQSIVNSQVDLRLVLAAMSLQSIVSNKTF